MPHFPAWIVYFANLGLLSWSLLWSWTGMGWAAAAVSVLLFIAEIHRQAKISYQQRYTELSPAAVLDSLRQSLSPTLRSYKTKIAVRAWICFYLIAAGRVIWTDRSESTQTIALLRAKNQELEQSLQVRYHEVSPAVNTANPDESNRARALRDHHYDLLRPVLKSESSHLKVVAEQVGSQGHFALILEDELPWFAEREAANSPSAELWPEEMSRDLANHFGEYDKAKHNLQSEIDALDSEFRHAMMNIQSQIKPAKDLTPDWTEMAALSFVKKCLGHPPALDAGDGLQYLRRYGSHPGVGGFGRPDPELIAAKQAYQSIEPTAMGEHCESLKRRADKVKTTAENLSTEAILLSEGVVLNGTCRFLKKVD